MSKIDLKRLQHLSVDPAKAREGVDTEIPKSDFLTPGVNMVLKVRRAAGPEFVRHADAVFEKFRMRHGRGKLSAEESGARDLETYAWCVAGFVSGVPAEDGTEAAYSPENARALMDFDVIAMFVKLQADTIDAYLRERVEEAKDDAGKSSAGISATAA